MPVSASIFFIPKSRGYSLWYAALAPHLEVLIQSFCLCSRYFGVRIRKHFEVNYFTIKKKIAVGSEENDNLNPRVYMAFQTVAG